MIRDADHVCWYDDDGNVHEGRCVGFPSRTGKDTVQDEEDHQLYEVERRQKIDLN